MAALTREELIEACAALYSATNERFMLPPLIQGAEVAHGGGAQSSYRILGGEMHLEFLVAFDAEFTRRSGFPLEKLPLLFKAQLRDRDERDLPIQLDETEMAALTYAFLLGVKAPIALVADEDAHGGECSIQLAPAFYVEWRQRFEAGEQSSAEDICRAVAAGLYARSRELFLTEADGLSVWSLRAAQDLFGEPKPSPQEMWARFLPSMLLPAPVPAASPIEQSPGPAALVPAGTFLRRDSLRLRHAAAAAAAMFLATASGAAIWSCEHCALASSPATVDIPETALVEPVKTASIEAPQAIVESPPAIAASPSEPAVDSMPLAATGAVAATAAPRDAARKVAPAPHKTLAAANARPTSPRSAVIHPPASRVSRRRARNPFTVVGRALEHFTAGVAKSLHRLTRL